MPRYGNTAVDRNRLKRRLREIVRQEVFPDERGLDIIIKTAPSAYSLTFAELRAAVHAVLGRLKT